MSEVVSEADLNAYIDDQLDNMRRLAVEDYLARNPQLASRVMADLRARDSLRLVLHAPMRAAEGATVEAAARLKHRMMWRSFIGKLRKVAAVGLFMTIGWFAREEVKFLHPGDMETVDEAPVFVADALIAYRTEQMRAEMETPSAQLSYDPAAIEARMNIRIPQLPPNWSVNDVQIFPSHEGGSVEASIVAESLGRISMFAERMDSDRVLPPTLASNGAETTIYWQSGHEAVALTATGSRRPLQRAGWALFANAVTAKP